MWRNSPCQDGVRFTFWRPSCSSCPRTVKMRRVSLNVSYHVCNTLTPVSCWKLSRYGGDELAQASWFTIPSKKVLFHLLNFTGDEEFTVNVYRKLGPPLSEWESFATLCSSRYSHHAQWTIGDSICCVAEHCGDHSKAPRLIARRSEGTSCKLSSYVNTTDRSSFASTTIPST